MNENETIPSLGDEARQYQLIIDRYKFASKVIDHRKLPQMWEKYEKQYRNKYWEGSGRPLHLTRFSSNALFEAVEVVLPLVASRPPRPDIVPEPRIETIQQLDEAIEQAKDEMSQKAAINAKKEFMERLNDWVKRMQRELVTLFRKSEMSKRLEEGYREYAVKGTLCLKSEYEPPSDEYEKGRVINRVCDITTLFPDSEKGTIEECEESWFIQAEFLSVEEIKKRWGVTVKGEGEFDVDGTFRYYNILDSLRGIRDALTKSAEEDPRKKGYALVVYYYCSDNQNEIEEYEDEMVDEESGEWLKDDDGNVLKETKQRSKYPYGKIVTIIRSHKDKVVEEKARPYKRLPFFMISNYKRSNDIWGTSEGLNIEPHTDAKNMLLSNIVDNARLTGNPQKTVGFDVEEEVDNEPGRTYRTNYPEAIRNLDPPNMPSYIERLLLFLDQDRDKMTGIMDAFRAESKTGDSGTKTKALIAQATGRMQPKVSDFIELMRKIYEHWTWIIRQFYPELVLQKDEDENGTLTYHYFKPQEFSDVNLDIDISVLAMMPFDNYSEFEEALVLHERGLISGEQLVDIAPTLRDKQRAKDFIAEQQEKQSHEQETLEAFEVFQGLAQEMAGISETQPNTPQEEELFVHISGIVEQFPEFIQTQEFKALPDRARLAMAAQLAGVKK